MESNSTFSKLIVSKIIDLFPRYLGFCDRSESSRTFGCFDRYYWHYKQKDFPNVRFQEALYLLTLAFNNPFPDSFYYQNEKLRKWIEGSIEFFFKIQNKDGSFNELYPYERSFCGTAFSTYLITEASLAIDYQVSDKIVKTGNWLLNNNNNEVVNQLLQRLWRYITFI